MDFNELGLTAPILKGIASENYDKPTPIQNAVIPKFLNNHDIVGCLLYTSDAADE